MSNNKMEETVKALEKKGFRVNWVDEDCTYMMKKKGASTFYADLETYEDTVLVNGGTLKEFLASL